MTTTAPALKYGWTTGACATAAAKAAFIGLCTGAIPSEVSITLPKGEKPSFPVLDPYLGDGWASACIEKDAGDDPDVTHGALIEVRVARRHDFDGIHFHAGEGVGRVTKPGLPIPVGEPAINPVPRQMINAALAGVAMEQGVSLDLDVTISVPGGEKLAQQTWNPRLGIEGGLSILGTTGIVRPFSCSAWIASIHRGIDVARATSLEHVVAATGATSEACVRGLYDLPDHAFLDMGDFAGGVLKYLRSHPVPRLTFAGGPGKMSKLAQGALDLHSKRSQVDFALLAEWAGDPRVMQANTALEAFEMAGQALGEVVVDRASGVIREALQEAPIEVEVLVVDRSGQMLARKGFV